MTTHNSHTIENHPTKESSTTPKKKRRRGAKARLQAHLRTSSLPSTQTPSTQTPSTAKNNPNNTNNSNNTNNDSSPSKQKKRTKKRIPKAGEEGFMTPTQLRNARKRRAKRSIHVTSTTTTISIPRSMPMSNSNHIRNHDSESQPLPQDSIIHKGKITFSKNDPSMRYIQNPRKAPIVKSAIRFFQHHPTFQSHNRNFQLVLGPLVGWRTVSKLAVRKSMDHKVTIGLFTPKTHSILSIPNCPAHHPSINHATQALQSACESCHILPYDEHTGKGSLRYVCINVERTTRKTQITLVWNSTPKKIHFEDSSDHHLDQFVQTIIDMGTKTHPIQENSFSLHSLWIHKNTAWKHSNAIFDISIPMSENPKDDSSWKLLYGPDHIQECLLPPPPTSNATPNSNPDKSPPHPIYLHFPPNVFRQANIDAFAKIVENIRTRVIQFHHSYKKNQKDVTSSRLPSILELYGGVGTIGLHLADLASSIICSDENIHNPKCFQTTVSQCLPFTIAQGCTYFQKNASDMVQHNSGSYLQDADIIIVDPPRKGLDDTVVDALIEKRRSDSHKLLVYVSCGFDAFQKNCHRLEQGGWTLEHAEGHILFPGSDAIETLAYFVC